MNFDKKTLLAFILIGFVLLLINTPIYKRVFFPELYKAQQLRKIQQMEERTEQKTDSLLSDKEVDRVLPAEKEPLISDKKEMSASVETKKLPEKLYEVDSDLYKAVLNSRGATLVGWALKNYKGPDDKAVQMLPENALSTLSISFISNLGDTIDTSDWSFITDSPSSIRLTANNSATIEFVCDLGNDRRLIKKFTFFSGSYHIDMVVSLVNMGDLIAEKVYFLNADDGLAATEKRLRDDMYYAKAAIAAGGEVNKKFKANGQLHKETGDIDWVAVRTKYFALAIVPQGKKGLSGQVLGEEIQVDESTRTKWKKYAISLTMPFLNGDFVQDSYLVYLGPLDQDIIKSYKIGLEDIMDFGFVVIQPFSKAILWSLKKMHTFIPNYGIVLILFSIIIKIIVYPLTRKSYESMQKMQALQPKMNEIKEKYGSDPQRLNKETMKLYKTEGVNPAGGCLPTLLQMPLLWGLFIVFRSTIELRGQGFIWWIKDLSMPDAVATLPFTIPMYGNSVCVLPLFMGATMLIQQKMSVSDPKQKMMIYFMPLFLTLLFNQFPAGLNLYYALFNLLSIIQQKGLLGLKKQTTVDTVSKGKRIK
jgi:YidC/Oxa1 family membrane protein insertase